MIVPAAAILAAALLVFLAWRGLRLEPGEDAPAALTWREADEADLF